MNEEKAIRLLESYADLEPGLRDYLCTSLKPEEFGKGDFLVREGSVTRSLGFTLHTWPSFNRHRAELLQKYYLQSDERVMGETARLVSQWFHASVFLKATVSVNNADMTESEERSKPWWTRR